MLAQRKIEITAREYLVAERVSEIKHEFCDGELWAMTGASRRHNRIALNLARMLDSRLATRPCGVYVSDMRVKIETMGKYTYPDVVVSCGEEHFEDDEEEDTLLNPILIMEILSDSTETYDKGEKFFHYRLIPSFMEYVLISQKEHYMERFTRERDGSWSYSWFRDRDRNLALHSVGCTIRVGEIYERVALPNPCISTRGGTR